MQSTPQLFTLLQLETLPNDFTEIPIIVLFISEGLSMILPLNSGPYVHEVTET